MIDDLLLDYSLKNLMILRRPMVSYLERGDHSPVFLKAGHKHDSFHRLGKDFFFKQQLYNFTKTGDNSRLIFFLI